MVFSMNTQQNTYSNVINFINDFKKKYPEAMEDTFLHGYCYWFAIILESRFGGNICYEPIDNHFFTLIEDKYYDISGEVSPLGKTIWAWEIYKMFDKLESERIERDCIRKDKYE